VDFEWDSSKAEDNLKRHKVSFLEAIETFSDPNGLTLRDEKHSKSEERFYWIGKSSLGRVLTTRYTRRDNKIRVIGSSEWREFKEVYYGKTKHKESKT